ncbi:MAG: hypothetical protein ABI853_00975 [Sphingomicrobium sp.]
MHRHLMRRYLALSVVLFAAACAPRPQAVSVPVVTPQPPSRPQGNMFGLSAQELVGHFGKPALQIREGSSVKLQFRGPRCVLDAYLYPARDGQLRVTYIDTRGPSGADMDQAACILALETPS